MKITLLWFMYAVVVRLRMAENEIKIILNGKITHFLYLIQTLKS